MRKIALALVVLSLTGCNKKPKLEGKVVGFKPGSKTVIVVHAKATKGSKIWCSSGGYGCDVNEMPSSGEMDVDVDLSKGDSQTPKKVMLTATWHDKNQEQVPLDLATALPPALDVNPFGGWVSCPPRDCLGHIDFAGSSADLTVPPWTTLEIGSSKLTADAQGKIQGPVTFSPASKDLSLVKICDDKSAIGTVPVTMTFADKAKATGSLSMTYDGLRDGLLKTLEGVKKGPVLFGFEKGGAVRGKPGVIVHKSTFCYAGGASDATLKDLRVVVFTEDKSKREDECNYAFDDGTHGTADITMHDQLATAYDRATGRVLGTKMFMATKDCDREVTSKTKNLKDQAAWPDGKAVAAWAATLAR